MRSFQAILRLNKLLNTARSLLFAVALLLYPCADLAATMDLITSRRVTRRLIYDATQGTEQQSKVNNQHASSVNVYCRIRPFSNEEQGKGVASCILPRTNKEILCVHPLNHRMHPLPIHFTGSALFSFSAIFDQQETKEVIFERSTLLLISHLFRGHNAVVFAHGLTATGKKFTIQGSHETPGILSRALDVIINSTFLAKGAGLAQHVPVSDDIANLTDDQVMHRCHLWSSSPTQQPATHDAHFADIDYSTHYSGYVSFVEIYNAKVYDLFENSPEAPLGEDASKSDDCALVNMAGSTHDFTTIKAGIEQVPNDSNTSEEPSSRRWRPTLKLKERFCSNPSGKRYKEVYAEDLKEVHVKFVHDIERLLDFGCNNRNFMHSCSNSLRSRGHAIFIITSKQEGEVPDANGMKRVCITYQMQIVDLSGREKMSNAGDSIDQIQELRSVNIFLMSLSRCLEQMREDQRLAAAGARIVPFRDNRLTRLLHGGLSTGSAVMIETISPSLEHRDETIHTLNSTAISPALDVNLPRLRRVVADVNNANSNEGSTSIDEMARPESPSSGGDGHKKPKNGTLRVLEPEAVGAENVALLDVHSQEITVLKERLMTLHEKTEKSLDRQFIQRMRIEKLEGVARLAEDALLEADQEREQFIRENRRLREKLAHAEAKTLALEIELRADRAEEVRKSIDELVAKYEKQIEGHRNRARSYGR